MWNTEDLTLLFRNPLEFPGNSLAWLWCEGNIGLGFLFIGHGCIVQRFCWEGGNVGETHFKTTVACTEDDVSSLCIHMTLPLLVIADDSGAITLVNTSGDCSVVRVLKKGGHTSLATAALFLPVITTMNTIISGGCDEQLLIWDGGTEGARGPLLATSVSALLEPIPKGKESCEEDAVTDEDFLEKCIRESEAEREKAEEVEGRGGFNPNPPFIHALVHGPSPGFVGVALGSGCLAVVCIHTRTDGGRGGGTSRKKKPCRPHLALHWASKEAHSSAICGLATVGTLLVSAGNDGMIKVWKWSEVIKGRAVTEPPPIPFRAWKYVGMGGKTKKINFLSGGKCSRTLEFLLAVADTSKVIQLFSL